MPKALMLILILFAQGVLVHGAKSYDDKIMEVTCLGKYTGVFHSFIHFSENSTSTEYYTLRTVWLLTYPGILREKLIERGMTIYDKNPTSKCGWTTVSHIKWAAISTGTIYRKISQPNDRIQEISSEILTSNYPTLEIVLLTVIPITAFTALVIACCMYGYRERRARVESYSRMQDTDCGGTRV